MAFVQTRRDAAGKVTGYKVRGKEPALDEYGNPERDLRGHVVMRDVSYGSYRRKRDADARFTEVENELASAGRVVPNAVRETPLATYATAWIAEAEDDVRTGALKARTARDRRDLYRRYIAPVFGARPAASIRREEVGPSGRT